MRSRHKPLAPGKQWPKCSSSIGPGRRAMATEIWIESRQSRTAFVKSLPTIGLAVGRLSARHLVVLITSGILTLSTWRANAESDRRQSLKVVWSTPAAAQHMLKGAPRSMDSSNCATSFFVFFVGRPGRLNPLRVGRRCFEAYAGTSPNLTAKMRQREIWKSSSRGALLIGEWKFVH